MDERVIAKYYENDFPQEKQLVMVECISCEENGCFVELLEYECKKGMIPLNQYSISMKRSIHRAMRVGKIQVARVVRVDANKGYIDLSKRQVLAEDENAAKDKFAKAKSVHSILIHIAQVCNKDIKQLCSQFIWPLYKGDVHPLDVLKMIMIKQDKVDQLGISDEKVKKALVDQIKRRFKRPVLKSMAIFKISIKIFNGIDFLKKVLKAGVEESSSHGYDVKITILGAPDYLAEVFTASKEEGQEALNYALHKIEQLSKELDNNRQFEVKTKPKIVGDSRDTIQQIYAEEMEKQNFGNVGLQMEDEEYD